MKRLAFLAAAALLGTACGTSSIPPCDSTITTTWAFQQYGVAGHSSCAQAGVTNVDVYLDDTPVLRVACSTGGMTIPNVSAGSHLVTVEGLDATQRIVYRDEFSVDASTCGDHAVAAYPSEGVVELQYTLAPVNQCTLNPSYMWFSVFDGVARRVTAAVDANSAFVDQTAYACSSAVRFTLPSGPYTLQSMQEMAYASGAFSTASRSCTAPTFTVAAAASTGVPIVLTDVGYACP